MSKCIKKYFLFDDNKNQVKITLTRDKSPSSGPLQLDVSTEFESALTSVKLMVFSIFSLTFPFINFYKPHFRRKRLFDL